MKADIDNLSPVQRKIRLELPAETVDREFSRAYQGISQRVKVRGFRPGKVPRSVLQGIYGDDVKGQVRSQLVENSLGELFKERGIKVVSRPEIEAEDLEEGKAFAFSAVVEVKPEFEIKDYLGQEVEKIKLAVEEEQVETALCRLQESRAHLEPVEDREVVESGDYVILDFVGSVDGKPFPGAKGESYPLEVGKGNALPQFEEAIIGLKKGEEHTIRVPYPKDYFNKEIAGKMVVFSVNVRDIKKKILPSLDDEFAKDHGESATLDELKQIIRTRLENEIQEIQRGDLKERLLTQLIEANPFEVPPSMVNHQVRYLTERRQAREASQGSVPSEPKPSMEQMRKDLEPQALRQVRGMLLVEKISGLEKIEVQDKEVREKIDAIVRSAGRRGTNLREIYGREDAREELRSQMIFDRTLDLLLEQAIVKEEVEPTVDAGEKKS